MKTITYIAAFAAFITFCACTSQEEKNKKIEEIVALRVKQICESTDNTTGALDNYGQKMQWMMEDLTAASITSNEDTKAATDLFDKKLKESCPEKFPK